MSNPYPLPGQPNSGGYPQQPPPFAAHDPAGFPPGPPGPPYRQGAPGGGTAKAAAGLGIALAVLRLVEMIYLVVDNVTSGFSLLDRALIAMIVGHLLEAVLLVLSATFLFRARAAGRAGLAVVAALVLPYALANVAFFGPLGYMAIEFLTLVVGIAVLVLCLIPPTGRWLGSGPTTGAPFAGQPRPAQPSMAPGAPLPGQARPY